ncbi:glutamyl-tRNA reductase [Chloroflexota bacterium]
MQVCVTGLNYKKAPVEIRSRVAIGSAQLPEALISLHKHASQGIILATCNRTEIYTTGADEHDDASASLKYLAERGDLPVGELLPHTYTYSGETAVRHLFQVASGLDSMITGEYEILGQVKRALEEAMKTGLIGLPLLNLFRDAIRTGRRARLETAISKNAISVSSAAVDLAAQIVGDMRQQRIVVIGAGEAGSLVAKTCKERGASQIVVVNRSPQKGVELADALSGCWVPMEELERELSGCDVVISCSGAPHTVLKFRLVEDAVKSRQRRPMVIIDIAVPRDVDPQVKSISNIYLYDIDDLVNICQDNHKHRQEEIQRADSIVGEEVIKFMRYWRELGVRPLVKALLQRAEEIRRSKLEMTLKKMPELSGEQKFYLDTMTKAIVQNILHEPVKHLKNNQNKEGYAQVVEELFSLDK